MNIKVYAPAKINLNLEILGKLNNGYHKVDMIMQSIGLCDEITVKKSSNTELSVCCSQDIGCSQEKNLAYKAAREFLKYIGEKNSGIRINILKNIPHGAGLAGGSADAAAVFYALNLFFNTKINNAEILNLANKIGSDVPFCFLGGCAHATEDGTKLTLIPGLKNCFIVVVKPDINICTKEAYALCDNLKISKFKTSENIIELLKNNDLKKISKNIFNRFEEVLDNEEIFEIKRKLCKNGALGAIMSGSGSAVFGIFENKISAEKCKMKLGKNYKQTFLCTPLSHGVYC